MTLTKKQMEFWTFVLVLCIAVSITVMLIDFGIKAAILEESTRLRLLIEEHQSGRKPTEANADRSNSVASDNASVPVPILVDSAPGMEAADVPNGTEKAAATARNRRRAQPGRQANPRTISDGNESVG